MAMLSQGCRDAQEKVHQRLQSDGFAYSADDFLRAVTEGRMAPVKRFLEAGVNPNAADTEGTPALIHAASRGHGHLVALLVAQGADIQGTGPEGITPLIAAAAGGDRPAVRTLLDAGVDVHARNNQGLNALCAAALEGHAGIVEILVPLSPDACGRALQLAALKDHTAVMDVLLNAGTNPDVLAQDGRTPLMFAAARGHQAAVRLLCHRGAGAALKSLDGRTAAGLAMEAGHGELAGFLQDQARRREISRPENSVESAIAAAVRETPAGHSAADERDFSPPPEPSAVFPVVSSASKTSDTAAVKPLAGLRLPEAEFGHLEALPDILRMTDFQLRRLPVVLHDVAAGHDAATVKLLDENREITVKVGDSVPGTGCVVEKLRRRHLYKNGKSGELVNVSEIHLKREKTGERFKALKDRQISSGENAAHLRLTGMPAVLEAREGDEFRLGSLLLKVTALKAGAVTVENRLTRETVTLTLQSGETRAVPATAES